MIYLDNGATSFPKPRGMTMEMEDCILNYCGNPGRSGHAMSLRTGQEVYNARKKTAEFFNIKDHSRLIFTKNTTEALNMGLMGFLRNGDHVVTTSMEHNSVLRPLKYLESRGVTHTIVEGNSEGFVSCEDMERAITEDTALIAMTASSNVTGTLMPVREVGMMAKRRGIPFLVDGAQCAGSIEIDVEKSNISMLAFPGHKGLLGPLGTGGLYVKGRMNISPLIYGGTGTESMSRIQPRDFPEGFESGTVNAPAIIGLGYSVSFIDKVGIESIRHIEEELISRFEKGVRNMKKVRVYGPEAPAKSGISLFNIEGSECEDVTDRLNREYGIAMRGGFHCAGLAHRTIGTGNSGAVRLSVGPFNTRREIDRTLEAIWKISK